MFFELKYFSFSKRMLQLRHYVADAIRYFVLTTSIKAYARLGTSVYYPQPIFLSSVSIIVDCVVCYSWCLCPSVSARRQSRAASAVRVIEVLSLATSGLEGAPPGGVDGRKSGGMSVSNPTSS